MRSGARAIALGLLALLIARVASACTGCVHNDFVVGHRHVPFWTFLFQMWALILIVEWRLAESGSPHAHLRAVTSGYLIALVWYPLASLIAAAFTIIWERTAYRSRKRAPSVWSADALVILVASAGWFFYYPTYLLVGRVPRAHFFFGHVPPPHFLMIFLSALPGFVLLGAYLVKTRGMNISKYWSAAMLVLCGLSPLVRNPSYAAAWAYFFSDPPEHFGKPSPWPGDATSLTIVAVSQYVIAVLPIICGAVLWRLDRDEARRKINRRVLVIACILTGALVATKLLRA